MIKFTQFLAGTLLACSSLACSAEASTVSDKPTNSADSSTQTQNADSANAPGHRSTLTFALVGDIMMGTTFPDSINGTHLPRNNGRNLFDSCRDLLSRADIAAGNLEGNLLDGPGQRRPMRNPNTYFVFRMPTAYVTNLTDAGFDFLGMANNHVNDFGEAGRRSTMKTLREAGLAYAGLRSRCEIAYLNRNGLRIAMTQFGHGGGNLDVNDLSELRRIVKQMKDSADVVVVAFHGGAEGAKYTHVPFAPETYVGERRGDVVKFARAAIDAGADLVYGHGPHVPRAAELHNGHLIIYSLGNFCTPYRMGLNGASGYAPLAEVTIDAESGEFLSGRIHSFIQQRGRGPVADPANSAAKLMQRLSGEDFPKSPLHIAADGTLTISPQQVAQ